MSACTSCQHKQASANHSQITKYQILGLPTAHSLLTQVNIWRSKHLFDLVQLSLLLLATCLRLGLRAQSHRHARLSPLIDSRGGRTWRWWRAYRYACIYTSESVIGSTSIMDTFHKTYSTRGHQSLYYMYIPADLGDVFLALTAMTGITILRSSNTTCWACSKRLRSLSLWSRITCMAVRFTSSMLSCNGTVDSEPGTTGDSSNVSSHASFVLFWKLW